MEEGKQVQEGGDELFEAQTHLFKHLFNFLGSMCLKTALQLGIPDIIHIHGQPITLQKLTSSLKIEPSKSQYVRRLMRVLVHSGFFTSTKNPHPNKEEEEEEEEEVMYDLTPSSRLLIKNKNPTMFPFALFVFQPEVMNTCQFLGDWIYSDKDSPFHTAFGTDYWSYSCQNVEIGRLFNEAMACNSGMMSLVIKKDECKSVFRGLKSLTDVGGGIGSVGKIISEAFPDIKYTVLDLPQVVANLEDSENFKFVGGDMFQFIPSADAILLKLVLHMLNDEDCEKVLRKCKEAISRKGKEGKVIIIDVVINEEKDKHEETEAKLFYDIMMMSMLNGKQRDEKEWEKLFLKAGFSHYKITPLFGLRSLVEVYP